MFSGEKVLEDLRCDNSLMKTMVDRFGEDVTDQYQLYCGGKYGTLFKNVSKKEGSL